MFTRPLLIGRGPWAQKIYAALPHGVNATITGSITVKEDIREAHNRGNDCVIIASRTDSHYELLKLAFAAQLPVFCEKPMVTTVKEVEEVEAAWRAAGEPPFLCDFVHLWSHGFEYVWPRFAAKNNAVEANGRFIATPKFSAQFSGPVRRKDLHPVWDYGCHAIAMALTLGYDCRGLTLSGGYGDQWFLENDHVEVIVNANVDAPKRSEAHLEGIFDYDGETWDCYGTEHTYPLKDAPPLQRALKWFLNTERGAWKSATPSRDGMWLPVQVTRVLETICSPESPFK